MAEESDEAGDTEVVALLRKLGLEEDRFARFADLLRQHGFDTLEQLRQRSGELAALLPLGPRARLLREAAAAIATGTGGAVGTDPLEARRAGYERMGQQPPDDASPQRRPQQSVHPHPPVPPAALSAFGAALPHFAAAAAALAGRLASAAAAAGPRGANPLGAAARAQRLLAVCKRAQRALLKGTEGEGEVYACSAELRRLREKGALLALERGDPLKIPLPPVPQLAPPPQQPGQPLPTEWAQVLDSARRGRWVPDATGALFTQQEAIELRALLHPCDSLRRTVRVAAVVTRALTAALPTPDAGDGDEWAGGRWAHPRASPHRSKVVRQPRARWRGSRSTTGGGWQALSAAIKELPLRLAGLADEGTMRAALEATPAAALKQLYDFAADPFCSVAELRGVCSAAGGLAMWLHALAAFANTVAERRAAAAEAAAPQHGGAAAAPAAAPPPAQAGAAPQSEGDSAELLRTLEDARHAVRLLSAAAAGGSAAAEVPPQLCFPLGCEVDCTLTRRGRVRAHARGRIGVELRGGAVVGVLPEQLRLMAPPSCPRGCSDDDDDDCGPPMPAVGQRALWRGALVTVTGNCRGRVGVQLADGSRKGVMPGDLHPLSAQAAARHVFPCGLAVERFVVGKVAGSARGRVGVQLPDGTRLGLPCESVTLSDPAEALSGAEVELRDGSRGRISSIDEGDATVTTAGAGSEDAAERRVPLSSLVLLRGWVIETETVAAAAAEEAKAADGDSAKERATQLAAALARTRCFITAGDDDDDRPALYGAGLGCGWRLRSVAGVACDTREAACEAYASAAQKGEAIEIGLVAGYDVLPFGAAVRCVVATGRVAGHTAAGEVIVEPPAAKRDARDEVLDRVRERQWRECGRRGAEGYAEWLLSDAEGARGHCMREYPELVAGIDSQLCRIAEGKTPFAPGAESGRRRCAMSELRYARGGDDGEEGVLPAVGAHCRVAATGRSCVVTGHARGRVGIQFSDGTRRGALPQELVAETQEHAAEERFPPGCTVEVTQHLRGVVRGHHRGRVGVELSDGSAVGCPAAQLRRVRPPPSDEPPPRDAPAQPPPGGGLAAAQAVAQELLRNASAALAQLGAAAAG